MTTLNIRIDENLKNKAGKTLDSIGLDMSSAVKLFLNQVVTEKGLPFRPTKNLSIIKAQWDKEVSEALTYGKSYKNAKTLVVSIK